MLLRFALGSTACQTALAVVPAHEAPFGFSIATFYRLLCCPFQWVEAVWTHSLLHLHKCKGNKWLPGVASTDFVAKVLLVASEKRSQFYHVFKNLRAAELLQLHGF